MKKKKMAMTLQHTCSVFASEHFVFFSEHSLWINLFHKGKEKVTVPTHLNTLHCSFNEKCTLIKWFTLIIKFSQLHVGSICFN